MPPHSVSFWWCLEKVFPHSFSLLQIKWLIELIMIFQFFGAFKCWLGTLSHPIQFNSQCYGIFLQTSCTCICFKICSFPPLKEVASSCGTIRHLWRKSIKTLFIGFEIKNIADNLFFRWPVGIVFHARFHQLEFLIHFWGCCSKWCVLITQEIVIPKVYSFIAVIYTCSTITRNNIGISSRSIRRIVLLCRLSK